MANFGFIFVCLAILAVELIMPLIFAVIIYRKLFKSNGNAKNPLEKREGSKVEGFEIGGSSEGLEQGGMSSKKSGSFIGFVLKCFLCLFLGSMLNNILLAIIGLIFQMILIATDTFQEASRIIGMYMY